MTWPKYTISVRKTIFLLFVIAFLAWLAHLGWHSYQLVKIAAEARTMASAGIADLELENAAGMVHQAAIHLNQVERDLRVTYPILKVAATIPGIGPTLGQAQPLLQFGNHLAQAGDALASSITPLFSQIDDGNQQSLPRRAFSLLKNEEQNLRDAAHLLDLTAGDLGKIDPSALPARLRPLYNQIATNFPLLQHGAALLPILPQLLGDGQPVDYLVIAQNRDELRATGGFITGIGTVRLDSGDLVSFEMGDSYRIDDFSKPYPPPPEAIQRLMLAGYWVTRDANWSPDFPTSARDIQELFTLSTGQETAGVFAFDQEAVRRLLSVTGPIQLEQADTPITAANVEDYMQASWAPDPGEGLTRAWWLQRKDFMKTLGEAILDQLLNPQNPRTLVNLAPTMLGLIREGHFLVYLNDSEAQEKLAALDLANQLDPGRGDFLLLVDSNFGFNKVDAVVTRRLRYAIDLTDLAHPKGTVSISYLHLIKQPVECKHIPSYGTGTYEDLQTRCYWDYWRVYRPAGSTLLTDTAEPVAASLLLSQEGWSGEVEIFPGYAGTQVFAGVFVLPTDERQTISLQTSIPREAISQDANGQSTYTLRISKQPGLNSLPVTLTLELPAGYRLLESATGWEQGKSGQWRWTQTITSGQDLSITFQKE